MVMGLLELSWINISINFIFNPEKAINLNFTHKNRCRRSAIYRILFPTFQNRCKVYLLMF